MDTLRRTEVLIYLLLIAPRSGALEGEDGQLREWTSAVLERLAPDWGEEDRKDIAEHFASLVPRLRQTLGMVWDGRNALQFQADPQFLMQPEVDKDLFAERGRLLSRLARLNSLLKIPDSFPVAVLPGQVAVLPGQIGTLAEAGRLRRGGFALDLTSFLTEPGLDALDNETFARLLARDTGA